MSIPRRRARGPPDRGRGGRWFDGAGSPSATSACGEIVSSRPRLGPCLLSTVHVEPTAAGDLFGRVEAIPRPHVIGRVEEVNRRE